MTAPVAPVDVMGADTGRDFAADTSAQRTSNVERVLENTRRGLRRVGPFEALAIMRSGGLLVDIRPYEQRKREGEIPGALIIERNVLEWRLDPRSPDKLDVVTGENQQIVIICSEGYASSLAAASLKSVGVNHATDLQGGVTLWARLGLPMQPGGSPAIHDPIVDVESA